MAYDPEKYREKREKVLGIRKRTLGFGTLVTLVSVIIIAGIGLVTVPQAVSFMATRHLDDAIFKLESAETWPKAVLEGLEDMAGVKTIMPDHNDGRLVITFDRRKIELSRITLVFDRHHLDVSLLNQINHNQHQHTMKAEAEADEAS